VILGTVTADGVPTIELSAGGVDWTAVVDTGFNGDLELPRALQKEVNARFLCRIRSLLAGGHTIEEDNFLVDFAFDGAIVTAEATFTETREILIGTGLLNAYRLEIDFPKRALRLEKTNS
jgi:predicted aspartyl protease